MKCGFWTNNDDDDDVNLDDESGAEETKKSHFKSLKIQVVGTDSIYGLNKKSAVALFGRNVHVIMIIERFFFSFI